MRRSSVAEALVAALADEKPYASLHNCDRTFFKYLRCDVS